MKTRIAGRRVFHGVCAVSPWGLRRRSIVHGLAAALGAELITISGLAVPAALAAAAGPEGAASDPASASWLAPVESRIAEEEYHLTWQTQIALPGLEASWQAPNRAQGFRTYFTTDGVRVIPRDFVADPSTGAAPDWEWRLRLTRWGRPGDSQQVEAATVRASGNNIDYDRVAIVESYINEPRGLEQIFTIPHAPQAPPPNEAAKQKAERSVTCLDMSLEGSLTPNFSEDGQAIDFAAGAGLKVIHYAGLRVTDATGRELRAWMEGFSGPGTLRGVRIAFEDGDAVYPVTVDPLATIAAWTTDGNQGSAHLGFSVGTAGDVNNDGFSDVIVGAYSFDNGQTDEGRAYVFHGSASGLSSVAAWTAEGNQTGAEFGFSVATAGDVNGDGYSDVIVGARFYDNPQTDEGRVFVYYGSPLGLSSLPAWTKEGNQAGALFGASVATAGDVNGDGYSDVIIGAYSYDNDQINEGRAFVYHGSANGLGASPAWTAESNQSDSEFARSVATAGDVNGDGYADVIVGAPRYDNVQTDEGRAFVYLGSVNGLGLSAAWTAESNLAGAFFGFSVATAGDVNGDGRSDVIIGAHNYANGQYNEGRAFVYLGVPGGIATSPAWTTESNQIGAQYGISVATAGDVNGDGYADVIVGAYNYDNLGYTNEGRAYVYLGSASGLSSFPDWTAEGYQDNAHFGVSVATAGDVNGDGYADVIVGAYTYYRVLMDEGRAYVYLGSAAGPESFASWTAEGGAYRAHLGLSVARAGDVNGDGYADVIVGASPFEGDPASIDSRAYVYLGSAAGLAASPAWTAGGNADQVNFGSSVSTAGDVNGDGFDDIIVGAPGYLGRGRVFVYLGSASGLGASPAWTVAGNEITPQASEFGRSVSTAGDVNGDGYSDVIIGGLNYNGQGEGRAYVFLGSAAGLGATYAWTRIGTQAYAQFGTSVSTAGDVNRDGYSDVIVGAPNYTIDPYREGRAYVYLGSAAGLATSPAWTMDAQSVGFGRSVSTAGDVNGDGYSDVIVGEEQYGINRGRAYVYLGSSSGPATSPAWIYQGDQDFAFFGTSVSTAGDVNGDGYADVVVGAEGDPESLGRAYVFLGSASGLATIPIWAPQGSQTGSLFGTAVSTVGDVNGDGYADVVVGEARFQHDYYEEGLAAVYYGNEGRGLSLRPQQRRASDTGPIAHLGASDSSNSFRLNVLGRTPFGRSRVALQREVKRFDSLLNGTSINGVRGYQDTGLSGVSISEQPTGLQGATPYHWRERLRYDPTRTPFAQHSRWLTVPWKGWQETMLSTRGALVAGSIGSSLVVTKSAGVDLALSWGASCAATDTDYAVYEGTIGDFTSHASRSCGTGGATTWTMTPLEGNKYYLIVPLNAEREGSYGLDSNGAQILPARIPCLPQQVGGCP